MGMRTRKVTAVLEVEGYAWDDANPEFNHTPEEVKSKIREHVEAGLRNAVIMPKVSVAGYYEVETWSKPDPQYDERVHRISLHVLNPSQITGRLLYECGGIEVVDVDDRGLGEIWVFQGPRMALRQLVESQWDDGEDSVADLMAKAERWQS